MRGGKIELMWPEIIARYEILQEASANDSMQMNRLIAFARIVLISLYTLYLFQSTCYCPTSLTKIQLSKTTASDII